MTREETQIVLGILGTSFPQFGDMVHALRHPTETMRTYRDALEGVSFLLAKEVLHDWSTGKTVAPAAYERDQTVAKLCREVRERQDKQALKQQARTEVVKDRQQIEAERKAYQPAAGWLGAIYRRFEEKAALVKAGTLSHEDYMRYVDSVVAEERERNANL